MNKNRLTLAVMAAIFGTLLSACGGSDSDSSGEPTTPEAPTTPEMLSSPFIDGIVSALPYQCLDATSKPSSNGVTDAEGNFSYNKGDTCSFTINDKTQLGSITLNTRADYISPYNLASSSGAARIASLLQSLDTDKNHDNGITLNGDDLAILPAIDMSSDEAFEQSLAVALNTDGLSQDYIAVDIALAKENMDAAIAEKEQTLAAQEGGYYSEKVDEVVQQLVDEEGRNWEGTHFEQELADYKRLLGEDDSSNGKDKELMLALITLMEVTNDPIVASRIDPENEAGYTEMLPQVLEMIFQGSTFTWKDPKNITTDMADLMGKYAVKATEAADMIARSFNSPDRIAVYGKEGQFVINYDQAMAIRTSAMALASGLNIVAAYDYGDDENYLPKKFKGTVAALEERCTYPNDGSQYQCVVNKIEYPVSADYMQAIIYPNETAAQETVMKLRTEAPEYLALAKEQLAVSAQLGKNLECNLYEYEPEGDGNYTVISREPSTNPEQDCAFYFNEEIRGSIDELSRHLRDPKAQPDVTLYPETNDDGSYKKNTYVKMDLNVFFDTGVDRSSFIVLDTSKSCTYKVNDKPETALADEQDLGLSIATDELVCPLTEAETQEILDADGLHSLPDLDGWYDSETNTSVDIHAQAGSFLYNEEFKGKVDSAFDKMMIKCVKDGAEQDCMVVD